MTVPTGQSGLAEFSLAERVAVDRDELEVGHVGRGYDTPAAFPLGTVAWCLLMYGYATGWVEDE